MPSFYRAGPTETRRAARSRQKDVSAKKGNGDLGFEATLWKTADALRGSLDAADYKHVVLGLIFLKYVSDSFEERHGFLLREAANPESEYFIREERARYELAEDRDEYLAENIFWAPPEARWSHLQAQARQPTIGKTIDEALQAIERDNSRSKANHRFRNRQRETLFVDARKLGRMIDRTHRELTDEEIRQIANTYHAWRGEPDAGTYEDVSGFCKSATTDELAAHGYVLTPGRYVGAADLEDDEEPFEEKMRRLVATLEEPFALGERLTNQIRENLARVTHGLR